VRELLERALGAKAAERDAVLGAVLAGAPGGAELRELMQGSQNAGLRAWAQRCDLLAAQAPPPAPVPPLPPRPADPYAPHVTPWPLRHAPERERADDLLWWSEWKRLHDAVDLDRVLGCTAPSRRERAERAPEPPEDDPKLPPEKAHPPFDFSRRIGGSPSVVTTAELWELTMNALRVT
jgi:hypothetical protein